MSKESKTPVRDMLLEIQFLAVDELESRRQENKNGAEYDIVASDKDLEMFETFINQTYLNINNAIQYAINELRKRNPELDAAEKLEKILKSIQ